MSGVFGFFFKIDLLERSNYAYKPKEVIVEFCNELEWSPDTAGDILKKAFNNTWFEKTISGYFRVNKEASKPELIKNLGKVAQADKYHERALTILIDFIVFSNIIEFDETSRIYRKKDEVIEETNKEIIQSKEDFPKINRTNKENKKEETSNQTQPSSVNAIVNVNLDVKFSNDTDPEELAKKVNKFKELLK